MLEDRTYKELMIELAEKLSGVADTYASLAAMAMREGNRQDVTDFTLEERKLMGKIDRIVRFNM